MMFAAIPLVQAVALDAESFRLPAFLSSFDQWMRMREHQSFLMIKSFIDTKNFMSLCLNLVVLAFVPAVCEELFFRGFLQKTLGDIFSPFAAIFLTACIFSILHFQFYGIFSRLLLGGIIGYLYYLSGNITPGILAHFAYNSLMVVIGYIYRLSGLEIPDIEEKAWRQPLPWLIVSFIVLVVLIHLSYRMIHEERPPR
jgi:membrane protease YdiL (CAAX protease family)